MPERGEPFDPADPEGERTVTGWARTSALTPDLSGGVQLGEREGVWAHSFKCRRCTLHFVLFSWSLTRHDASTVICPECGAKGDFMHRITQLNTSRQFRIDPGREPEIYDVWPFRLQRTTQG